MAKRKRRQSAVVIDLENESQIQADRLRRRLDRLAQHYQQLEKELAELEERLPTPQSTAQSGENVDTAGQDRPKKPR